MNREDELIERRRGHCDAVAGHGPAIFEGPYMIGYRRGRAEIGQPMSYIPPKGHKMKQTKTRRMVFTKEEIVEAIRLKWGISGEVTRIDFHVVGKNDPDDWRGECGLSYEFEELIIEENINDIAPTVCGITPSGSVVRCSLRAGHAGEHN